MFRSFVRSFGRSVGRSVGRSFDQPVGQLFVLSIVCSFGQSFVQSFGRSVDRSPSFHLLLIEDVGNCTHSSIYYIRLYQLVIHFIPEFALTDLKVLT